jgi:hypothetical protein
LKKSWAFSISPKVAGELREMKENPQAYFTKVIHSLQKKT